MITEEQIAGLKVGDRVKVNWFGLWPLWVSITHAPQKPRDEFHQWRGITLKPLCPAMRREQIRFNTTDIIRTW